MCLAMPGQVLAVDASGATIESDGRQRRASTLLYPDLAVGDWVMVAAGTVVRQLTPAEATEIRNALMEALRLVDSQKGLTDAVS
ncbi:MAG: HypC/HybG/HupF family hydrogenase formation chaperone [Gemmatimonadales bacterium]|nr:MAG: HypC/HybG/HupF family hydrogenase formation chaperone [Gemmatimonadales bacterium]